MSVIESLYKAMRVRSIDTLVDQTADAYMADAYSSWRACVQFLLRRGYTNRQTEAILRSKWMRWAADRSEGRKPTCMDLRRFLEASFKTREEEAAEVVKLTAETFGE